MPPSPDDVQVRSTREALKAGLMLGVALSGVAIAWLLIANRVPALEPFALLRNTVAGAAVFVLLILVPVYRFRRHPAHLFACALTSWVILTAIYALLQIPFPRLGMRMGTFHFFMLGAVVLGLAASLVWVIHLVFMLRSQPAIVARKRVP
jgi:asparagine N-glycosylation enzyme membrane subunit Stt3